MDGTSKVWATRKWEAGEVTHYGKTHRESRLYSETLSKIYRYRWNNISRKKEPRSIKTSEGREGWCGWLTASERQQEAMTGNEGLRVMVRVELRGAVRGVSTGKTHSD